MTIWTTHGSRVGTVHKTLTWAISSQNLVVVNLNSMQPKTAWCERASISEFPSPDSKTTMCSRIRVCTKSSIRLRTWLTNYQPGMEARAGTKDRVVPTQMLWVQGLLRLWSLVRIKNVAAPSQLLLDWVQWDIVKAVMPYSYHEKVKMTI